MTGIQEGMTKSNCVLLGGETAEMPGMYSEGDYDLAGFSVGIVEKSRILDGSTVATGDALIGLASSGPHSNGYSLIRKIIEVSGSSLSDDLEGRPLAEWLLAPTRIYVKPLLSLFAEIDVHALAHITGGGISENIVRVLADELGLEIDLSAWDLPDVFKWLQDRGNIEESEMLRTFNCGIGMIVIVDAGDLEQSLEILTEAGETAWRLGEIRAGAGDVAYA